MLTHLLHIVTQKGHGYARKEAAPFSSRDRQIRPGGRPPRRACEPPDLRATVLRLSMRRGHPSSVMMLLHKQKNIDFLATTKRSRVGTSHPSGKSPNVMLL